MNILQFYLDVLLRDFPWTVLSVTLIALGWVAVAVIGAMIGICAALIQGLREFCD